MIMIVNRVRQAKTSVGIPEKIIFAYYNVLIHT